MLWILLARHKEETQESFIKHKHSQFQKIKLKTHGRTTCEE